MPKNEYSKFLKIFFVLILTYSLQLTAYSLYAQDKIIAIVNSEVITRKELNDFITFMRMQFTDENVYQGKELDSKIESIKPDLLDKLIEDRLIVQEAKKSEIKIDENMVKARLEQIKKRYPSETDLQNTLRAQGLTEGDLETKITEQLLTYNIIEQKVKNQIVVNPAEITDFYYKNIEQFKFPSQRNLRYLKTSDQKIAKEIPAKLKKGSDLNDLATAYSLSVNTLTVSEKDELKSKLKEIVFKLNKGQISELVMIDDYYYVFKLDEIILSRQENLAEVQDDIYAFLLEKKRQEKLINWLEELKKKSYIKITLD